MFEPGAKACGSAESRDARRIAQRRDALFREAPLATLRRWLLGAAWTSTPRELIGLPNLARLWLEDYLPRDASPPEPGRAVGRADGLCGFARDLSVPSQLAAYQRGVFPGGHFGPVKWFSPAERCVLFLDDLHIERSTRRVMKKAGYRFTFDRDFEGVIAACAAPRPGKWPLTWITPKIMRAYADLFDAGHAHSYEIWNECGELVGGGYGVAVGRAFFGESQFSRERDVSKAALTALAWHLAKWGMAFADGKWPSPTLRNMGFRLIPRDEFLSRLREAAGGPLLAGRWTEEAGLATMAAWQPKAAAGRKADRAETRDADRGYARTVVPLGSSTLALSEALLRLV